MIVAELGAPALPSPKFVFAESDCQDILHRLVRYAEGGGDVEVALVSRWCAYTRWGRNQITLSGEDQNAHLACFRSVRGARVCVDFNDVSDAGLLAAIRSAERLIRRVREQVDYDAVSRPDSRLRSVDEPVTMPQLLASSTLQVEASDRSAAVRHAIESATESGMLSAGYLEVAATSMASLTSWGITKYQAYTWARCTVTVRDPAGVGSGWAGIDWPDWSRVDPTSLAVLALEKCLTSRDPVAIEPGRYTTILEPQAIGELLGLFFSNQFESFGTDFDRLTEERGVADWLGRAATGDLGHPPFPEYSRLQPGFSRLGEKVMDERITISADPMDPELGFPPYLNFIWKADRLANPVVFHSAVWVEQGVLKALPYERDYAVEELGKLTGLPVSGAFRVGVTGPMTSLDEMIATTKRGLLVTRFDQLVGPYTQSLMCSGFTRDGLWLIENGKISKPVKNMRFVEAIPFVLNNVEQLGTPQRIFYTHPGANGSHFWQRANPRPVIVPTLKVRDFSFTALTEAI